VEVHGLLDGHPPEDGPQRTPGGVDEARHVGVGAIDEGGGLPPAEALQHWPVQTDEPGAEDLLVAGGWGGHIHGDRGELEDGEAGLLQEGNGLRATWSTEK
jgi:hypothetical protein